MREIPVGKARVALVDNEDYERISVHRWFEHKRKHTVYAGRVEKRKTLYMHREIMGLNGDDPRVPDHSDDNGLNNQKYNLSLCTQGENVARGRKRSNCSSRFKGVSFYTSRNKYEAYISINKKRKRIGYFESEIEAARAYNIAAVSSYGKFARLNEVS